MYCKDLRRQSIATHDPISFAALIAAHVAVMRLFGLGLTLAILADATLVRMVLVPAFMHVMGQWNWWAPAWLVRVHNRVGLREAPPPEEPLTSKASVNLGKVVEK